MSPTSDGSVTRLLAYVCHNAPPLDVVAACAFLATPACQRAVVCALKTAATLRGPPPPGYAASILTAVARRAGDDLEDELAVALAAALRGDGENEDDARTLPPPPPGTEWRAYFFGGTASSFPVVVAASRDFLAAGTGGAVWRAGGALAAALLARPTLVDGKALLELGCGCGLAGAAVAVAAGWVEDGGGGGGDATTPRLAPASLTLTDGDPGALAIATATLAANGVRGVEVGRLAWGGGGGGGESAPPLDHHHHHHHHHSDAPRLVIGADIMYDPVAAPALADLLARLLSVPGSAALLAGVERAEATVDAYTRALSAAGVTVVRRCPPLAEGENDCDDHLGPVWGEEDESGAVGWWWCVGAGGRK